MFVKKLDMLSKKWMYRRISKAVIIQDRENFSNIWKSKRIKNNIKRLS